MAPYLVFANDKRETAKELLIGEGNEKPTMGEIAKRVGVLWNQLDDAAKQVYKDKADELNAKAAKEYEEAGGDAAADGADGDGDDGEKGAEELGLPLARVKRIMKLDKEVKNMQVDASKCVAKCAELFIESLVEGSFRSMKANKRKTIKYGDVEHHVLRKQRLEFLHDHVWAFRPEEAQVGGAKGGKGGGKENDGDDDDVDGDDDTTPAKASPEAPPGARQVTDFFKKAAAEPEGVATGA